MIPWLVPFESLDEDQQRAVELTTERHHVVTGGTGSGKTQVLLHRAQHLCRLHNIAPEKYRIVVFSCPLRGYLRALCPLLNIPPENVITLRQLYAEIYANLIDKSVPLIFDPSYGFTRPYLSEIQLPVEELALKLKSPLYDFILIDEAQDLEESGIALFKFIARHVTVCIDFGQQIYPNRATETQILRYLGRYNTSVRLYGDVTRNPHIVALAAALLTDPAERRRFLSRHRKPSPHRETPLLYMADPLNYTGHLARTVRERQLLGDRIGILVPRQRHLLQVQRNLREAGVETEVRGQVGFDSQTPKIFTYHTCKGQSFDSVFMPYLEDCWYFWNHVDEDELRRLLFLGVTRATRWVYMSTFIDNQLPEMSVLKPLIENGVISVLNYESTATSSVPTKSDSRSATEDPLDFL